MRDNAINKTEAGFSTLVALTTLACLTAVTLAFTQALTVSSKAQRDSVSNTDIGIFYQRLQKLLNTEWSCTLSLRGSNFNDPISLMDPVNPGSVLAETGTFTGPFWSLSSIRMQNVRAVVGRPGIYAGELDLTFAKSMVQQTGAPMLDRVVQDIWFEASPEGYISRCYPGPIAQAIASSACTSLGGAWNADAAFGSQCTISPTPVPTQVAANDPGQQPGQVPTPASTPAPMEPAPVATQTPAPLPPAGLCFDTNAGIVALPNSQMSISGNGTASTGIYLMNGAKLSLSGNATVRGTLFEGTGASYSQAGNASVAHVTDGDLTSLTSDLTTFSAAETALTATTQLTKIDSSMTLSAHGRTVVLVPGDVNLTGNTILTLSGTASDTFVINVIGKITVSGNAQVVLAGGMPAKNVVFNNIGLGNEMVLAGNGSISGTFLALQRGAQVSGNGHLTGAVAAGGGLNTKITISGNGMAMTPQPFCTN